MLPTSRIGSPCFRRRATLASGFTLVELLVVITIIGVLAALLVVGVGAATRAAKRASVAVEIQQLSSAMEQYASKHGGGYPPDFANISLDNWSPPIAKQYPRFKLAAMGADFKNVHNLKGLDPSEALVFWLGGYSNLKGPWNGNTADGTVLFSAVPRKLLGFKPSPTKPFITIVTGANSEVDPSKQPNWNFTKPDWAFEFKDERLVDNDGDGFYEYLPPGGLKAPYVYFSRSSYTVNTMQTELGWASSDFGAAVPYYQHDASKTPPVKQDAATNWIPEGQNKYQIICAGLDNDFGSVLPATGPRTFPDGFNYSKADLDNITSFSNGKTLGDLKPEG